MHGLIFVTWEKYLAERFGTSLVAVYRRAIGEDSGERPLTSRVYDDEQLLGGVAAASRLTQLPVDTMLREFGRYFILNGLTGRLCAYLLNQVHSGRELLLVMRQAHEQMSQAGDGIAPPLFQYDVLQNTRQQALGLSRGMNGLPALPISYPPGRVACYGNVERPQDL